MKFNFMPMFSPDGSTGGGYQLTPEQLDGLSLGEENPGYETDEPELIDNELTNSDDDTSFEDEGENIPQTVNIPGIGEVPIDDVVAWKNSGLMQADYTRKTQEVADMRKQLEEQFAPYQKLDEMFASNPQLEQQFVEMLRQNNVQQPQGQNPQADLSNHPMFQQMQEQQKQIQEFMQQQQEQTMRQQVQQEWNDIYQKFPDVKGKEQELANFADQNNLNLDQAYMIMNFNNVKAQTQQEMVKNNMKKKPANTIKPNNNAKSNDSSFVPDGDYNSLVDFLMKKDINI